MIISAWDLLTRLRGESRAAVMLKPAPARPANFAQARQFLNGLSDDLSPVLEECAAHLKDLLEFVDRVQGQKALGYVSAGTIEVLKDHRNDGALAKIDKQPFGDRVPIFTEPSASLGLLAAVSGFAKKYLEPERQVPALCANDEHHKDVCDLFDAIEREGRAK